MEPTEQPSSVHLNNHHRRTLNQILGHPVSHNIEWPHVVSLLSAVGTVEEHRDGKLEVTLGSETQVFERPAGNDIDVQQVVDLRRMLTNAGFGTDDPSSPQVGP